MGDFRIPSPRTARREATRRLLHATVVEAIRRLLAERPWSAISMAEIAEAAGVSRQTLYNEFRDRRGLATAYAQWAATAFLDEMERVILDHADDVEGALVAAFEVFLDSAHAHPLVRAVEATSGIEGVAAFVSAEAGPPVVVDATERLADIIGATWPQFSRSAVVPVAETVVRLAISHLTVPTSSPSEAAHTVKDVLMPSVARLAWP